MSEKTPRQIGQEAQVLYDQHKDIQSSAQETEQAIAAHTEAVREDYRDVMIRHHGVSTAENREKIEANTRKFKLAIVDSVDLEKQSTKNVTAAREHFQTNEDSYYTLAIAEAALDGVDVVVEQPKK